jgi:radical SAM protein
MEASRVRTIRHPSYDLNQRPFLVIWEVTRACDLACVHCRASAIPEREPGELDTEEGYRLIDQVAEFIPPPPLFILTGGDPFKREDLFDLVRYGAEKGLPVSVSPSGTPTLTPENIRRLREAGAVAISFSIDGSTPAIHDGFRRVEGVYRWTLRGWEAAQSCGLKVQINTTVTPHNLEDLPNIFELVRSRGVMTWSVFFLVPTGRGKGLPQLSPQEFEDVMHFLYDVSKVLPVKTTEGHHYKRVVVQRTILEQRGIPPEEILPLGPTYRKLRGRVHLPGGGEGPGKMRRPPLDVNAGKGFVFINHLGNVFPSGFLPLAVGNVRSTPLGELYRTSPLFRSLRDPNQLRGRCGRCEFRTVCGGSRSRAFGVLADPLDEDPFCAYEPGSFPFQEDVARILAGGGGEG